MHARYLDFTVNILVTVLMLSKKALDRSWDREGKGASRCHQYLGIGNHYASSYY